MGSTGTEAAASWSGSGFLVPAELQVRAEDGPCGQRLPDD